MTVHILVSPFTIVFIATFFPSLVFSLIQRRLNMPEHCTEYQQRKSLYTLSKFSSHFGLINSLFHLPSKYHSNLPRIWFWKSYSPKFTSNLSSGKPFKTSHVTRNLLEKSHLAKEPLPFIF